MCCGNSILQKGLPFSIYTKYFTLSKEEEVVKGAGVIGHGKVAYYEASDQGDKSVFTVWFPWSLAGILFSITMTRMTRKIEEMEQIEWDSY